MIIGLGLIGSSMALAIRSEYSAVEIYGIDTEATATFALNERIIQAKASLENASQMDFILFATPIDVTLKLMDDLSQLTFSHSVLISDTCSTKNEIMMKAKEVFSDKNVKFIGGHPMAGSHKSGVHAADVNLFENAYYVLTEENQDLQELLGGLHAKFIIVDAKEHDQVSSQVSHFPHVIASSLVQQSNQYAKQHPLVKHLAAGGFRDMTRIAKANSHMWTSVLLSNSKDIVERINDYKQQLDHVSHIISQKDESAIRKFFDSGKK